MKHFRLFVIVGLVCSVLLTGVSFRPANADSLYRSCDNTQSPFYRPNYAFFDPRQQRFALADNTTNKVTQVIETNIKEINFIGWSPDCRYFAAGIGPISSNQTVIWDVLNNRRAGVFGRLASGSTHTLWWDEMDSNYLIVGTIVGQFSWNLATGEQIQLNHEYCGFRSVQWDLTRQQLLAVMGERQSARCSPYVGDPGVSVLDLHTGRQVAYYGNPGRANPPDFELSPDGRLITVYSVLGESTPSGPYGSTVWDRDTDTVVSVSADGINPDDIQLSPDKRFVAIKSGALLVYDFYHPETLEGSQFDKANFVVAPAGSYHWRFTSPTVIELSNPYVTRHFDLALNKYID